MRALSLFCIFFPLLSLAQPSKAQLTAPRLNSLAEDYIRLGLAIGQYDEDFVDAYYGPDSLKPATAKGPRFPKDSFLKATNRLLVALRPFANSTANAVQRKRAAWMSSQLVAFQRRIRIFSGEYAPFDAEAKDLFGVVPPTYTEAHFRSLVQQLHRLLPGSGDIKDRYQALASRFVIPKEALDTVFKRAIEESKRRTKQHYTLPADESFRLEYVRDKPWSGYNWYQGAYKSRIQYNTDITAYVDKAIEIAGHEGYPGHHVYNTLLEKNLYKDRGWVEISLYPLFSPQSLIAEGSANYGIEVAFPGQEKILFARNVLLPLAGLDTTGLSTYFAALAIKGALQYARNEVARGVLSGRMTEAEGLRWLTNYALMNEKDAARSLAFTRKYRSYVLNYTYGQDLVKSFIESKGGTNKNPTKRWSLFEALLSNEVIPADLRGKGK